MGKAPSAVSAACAQFRRSFDPAIAAVRLPRSLLLAVVVVFVVDTADCDDGDETPIGRLLPYCQPCPSWPPRLVILLSCVFLHPIGMNTHTPAPIDATHYQS